MKRFLPLLLLPFLAFSEERKWDQEKALKMTGEMIALEKKGAKWDEIKWRTDPAKALAEMKKTGKPALVYFYIDKGGPKAAPC